MKIRKRLSACIVLLCQHGRGISEQLTDDRTVQCKGGQFMSCVVYECIEVGAE